MAYSLKGVLREMEKTYSAFRMDSEYRECDYEMDLRSYERLCLLLKFFFDMQFHNRYDFEFWFLRSEDYDEK